MQKLKQTTYWGMAICLILQLVSGTLGQELQPTSFLPWENWYPINRGQSAGVRVLNWWRKNPLDTFNVYYQGQSVWNDPVTPMYFPDAYNSHAIDYYVNWQCGLIIEDPACENWFVYKEYMSQGDGQGDSSYLEHWARGGRGLDPNHPLVWEVYYQADAFPVCESTAVQNMDDTYLQDPALKAPLLMRLPDTVGETYVSPVVCTVIFDGYDLLAQDVIGGRTSHWFVINKLLEKSQDENNETIIKAQNLYYSDNPSESESFDTWCTTNQNIQYCTLHNGVWKSNSYVQDTITGKLIAYEIYWMREVPQTALLTNGFGAFQWWTWQPNYIEYDDVLLWQTTTCTQSNGQIACELPNRINLPIIIPH